MNERMNMTPNRWMFCAEAIFGSAVIGLFIYWSTENRGLGINTFLILTITLLVGEALVAAIERRK